MRHPPLTTALAGVALGSLLALAGCGGDETGSPHGGRPGGGGPGPWGGGTGGETTAAVPVEVTPVVRRSISSYIETNGTLEAEFEVDLVARTDGPVIELNVEEGDAVRKDQILARLDELELRAQLEIARVDLEESRLAYDRARNLQEQSLISSEAYDQARS